MNTDIKAYASIRVLVVGELATICRIYKYILNDIGITDVIEAKDNIVALKRIREGGIDLVITEVDSMDVIGLKLIESIRADPSYANIPILAGAATTDSIDAALQAGADGYTGWMNCASVFHDKIAQIMRKRKH